jgi:hypothetical protein
VEPKPLSIDEIKNMWRYTRPTEVCGKIVDKHTSAVEIFGKILIKEF